MTIALAEDQDVIRRMIADMLLGEHSIVFAGTSAEALLRFLHVNPESRLPELILLDISMDGMSGIEAAGIIKETYPAIKVIMLTSFDNDEMVFAAIQNGADGYCIKDEMAEKLLGCIHDVGSGGSYMSPGVARKAMQYLQKAYVPATPHSESPLSKRETEVLRLLINGESAAEIAETLFVSQATVKTHVYNIYQKLHVNNRMEAANLARSKGWV